MKETEKAEKNLKGCGKIFINERGNETVCKWLYVGRIEPEKNLCPECKARCSQHKQDCEDDLEFLENIEGTVVDKKKYLETTKFTFKEQYYRIKELKQTIDKYQKEGI